MVEAIGGFLRADVAGECDQGDRSKRDGERVGRVDGVYYDGSVQFPEGVGVCVQEDAAVGWDVCDLLGVWQDRTGVRACGGSFIGSDRGEAVG